MLGYVPTRLQKFETFFTFKTVWLSPHFGIFSLSDLGFDFEPFNRKVLTTPTFSGVAVTPTLAELLSEVYRIQVPILGCRSVLSGCSATSEIGSAPWCYPHPG